MTLSLLMYTLMMTTLVVLVGVLVVDAVRGLSRSYARRATRPGARAHGLPASSGARNHGVASTRS